MLTCRDILIKSFKGLSTIDKKAFNDRFLFIQSGLVLKALENFDSQTIETIFYKVVYTSNYLNLFF